MNNIEINNEIERKIEKISDLKDMLNKTKEVYGDRPAYKIRDEKETYKIITHRQVRDMVDALGTALIDKLNLKEKRIAVIGENRYEWGLGYLATACGTGIIVPLDKALPEAELARLIERSSVSAIFFSNKYENIIKNIKNNKEYKNNLECLISMDLDKSNDEVYSQKELIAEGRKLIEEGSKSFIDAKIDAEAMGIMLFTSGTTSESKVVMLSHRNICANLMAIRKALRATMEDTAISNLPLHHVFECTVGLLLSLYSGCQTVYSDGLIRLVDNLREYKPTIMFCVPGMYEKIYMNVRRMIDKAGRTKEFEAALEKAKTLSWEERKELFKDIHALVGGNIRVFASGAAALDPKVEEAYRLMGLNLFQGYGLTESSPVVAVSIYDKYRLGSIGRCLDDQEVKLADVDEEGMGELLVKGPNVMIGYYGNEKATKETLVDGWLHTGDLAKIDEDGYIFICGRKKSVIVLKNGKNIFPEEMEKIINRIPGVEESMVFGKHVSKDDVNNIKIHVEIVYSKEKMKETYNVESKEEILKVFQDEIKEINKTMPKYKSIRGIVLSEEPLIKTTTNKIKRQLNLDKLEKDNK